jgi:hypothetical protein
MKQLITILFLLALTVSFGQNTKLQEKRFKVLMEKYYAQKMDNDFLKSIISPADSNISLNTTYHVMVNEDKTKFVAFFLQQFAPEDFKNFRESKKDKRVNIMTTTDALEGGLFADLNTYAHTVTAVKYNKKWYYEKTNVTYFAAATLNGAKQYFFNYLQEWNFFKEKSTEFNPEFWETILFEKVSNNLANDPTWSDYIGLYRVVANQMRKEKEEMVKKKELEIVNKYIAPLLDKLKAENTYETVSTKQMSKDYLLIYPKDWSVIICPINVKEKDKEVFIRYFVLIPNEDNYKIYEWTYINPSNFKNDPTKSSFMEQINTLTTWNFSYSTIDDSKFWNDYVLLKLSDSFMFLKEIK